MSTMNRHVILNHVDTPLRILFWTKGEILLFVMPLFMGLILDQLTLGSVISVLNVLISRHYKRRFGKGQIQAVLYWYLPQNNRMGGRLKGIPPSYVRHYLG